MVILEVIMIGENGKNKKYDFKTLKIRPETYQKLVGCKSKIEGERKALQSFDSVINVLIEVFDK